MILKHFQKHIKYSTDFDFPNNLEKTFSVIKLKKYIFQHKLYIFPPLETNS